MTEWQPIRTFRAEDQAGRLWPIYLVSDGERVEPAEFDRDNRRPWRCMNNPDMDGSSTPLSFKPTHWMPLPAPPRAPLAGGDKSRDDLTPIT